MNTIDIDAQIAQREAEDIALSLIDQQREADRVEVFCTSGQGHQAVTTDDSGDQYRYIVYTTYCEDCRTVLGSSHP